MSSKGPKSKEKLPPKSRRFRQPDFNGEQPPISGQGKQSIGGIGSEKERAAPELASLTALMDELVLPPPEQEPAPAPHLGWFPGAVSAQLRLKEIDSCLKRNAEDIELIQNQLKRAQKTQDLLFKEKDNLLLQLRGQSLQQGRARISLADGVLGAGAGVISEAKLPEAEAKVTLEESRKQSRNPSRRGSEEVNWYNHMIFDMSPAGTPEKGTPETTPRSSPVRRSQPSPSKQQGAAIPPRSSHYKPSWR